MVKIIAEIGWNFMGDLNLAEKMVKSGSDSGADIVKFQYWNPERLKSGPWDKDGRREIYRKAQLNAKKIEILRNMCKKVGVEFLISVFNIPDAEIMKEIGIKKIKIPSHESANLDLHKYASENFDKIFVSLGAGSKDEICSATSIYCDIALGKEWVGMHCISSYPCPTEKSNLPRIDFLKTLCPIVGYSDHTNDIITPVVAVAKGAQVIEKHFTINKELPGRDNKFALDEKEFSAMVQNIRLAEKSLIYHGDDALDIEADTIKNYRGRWGGNRL